MQITRKCNTFSPIGTTLLRVLALLALVGGLLGCEEVVTNFVSVSAPPRPVAEAWLTNVAGESYVRLSYTRDLQSTEENSQMRGAYVRIVGENGATAVFSEHAPGLYLPADPSFVGQAGQRYRLLITHEVQTWEAEERMPSVPEILSITPRARIDLPIYPEDGTYWEVVLQDASSERSFYLWRVWADGVQAFSQQILLTNDRGLNGKAIFYEFPRPVEVESELRVRVYALSERAYQHFRAVELLTGNQGLSRTVPDNPPSNLEGEMLGFFVVAAFSEVRAEAPQE